MTNKPKTITMTGLNNSIIYREYLAWKASNEKYMQELAAFQADPNNFPKPKKPIGTTLFFNKDDIFSRLKIIFEPEDTETIQYNKTTAEMLDFSIASTWFKKNSDKFNTNAKFNFYNTTFTLEEFENKINELELSEENSMLFSNCSIVVPYQDTQILFKAPILHIRKQDRIFNIINKASELSKKSDVIKPFFQKMLMEEITKNIPNYRTFFAYASVNSNFDTFINKDESFVKGSIPIKFTTNINLNKTKKRELKFKNSKQLDFLDKQVSLQSVADSLNLEDVNFSNATNKELGEGLIYNFLNQIKIWTEEKELRNKSKYEKPIIAKNSKLKTPPKVTVEEQIKKAIEEVVEMQVTKFEEMIFTEGSVWEGLAWNSLMNSIPYFKEFANRPEVFEMNRLWNDYLKLSKLSASDIIRVKSAATSQSDINDVLGDFIAIQKKSLSSESELNPELIKWVETNTLDKMIERVKLFEEFENQENKKIENNQPSILDEIETNEGNRDITLIMDEKTENFENLTEFYEHNLKDKKLVYFDFETINPPYIATDDASTPPNALLVTQNSIIVAENNEIISSEDLMWDPANLSKETFYDVVSSCFKHCLDATGKVRDDVIFLMYSPFEKTQIKKILEICFPSEYRQLINVSQDANYLKENNIVDEIGFLTHVFNNNLLNTSEFEIYGDVENFKKLFFQAMTVITNLVDINDVFKARTKMFVATPAISQSQGISIKTIQKMLEKNVELKSKIIDPLGIKPRKDFLIKNGAEATQALKNRNLSSISGFFKDNGLWSKIEKELKTYCHTDVLNMVAVDNFIRETLEKPHVTLTPTLKAKLSK